MWHLAWYFLVTKQFELHSDNVLGGPEFVQCNPATSDPGLWLGGRWREFLNLRPICVWDTLWKIISCKNVDWEGWSWRSIYSRLVWICSGNIWTLYYFTLILFAWVKWNIWIFKSVSCSFLLCNLAELELMVWKKMISIEYKYWDTEQDYTLFNII